MLGDVNGDLRPDLLLGTNGGVDTGTLLYFNDGDDDPFDSLPALILPSSSGYQTKALALADLDRDGDLDLVIGNAGANKAYANDGHGVFTLTTATLGSGATALAVGDVDGDGLVDVVVGKAGGTPELYLNGASLAFTLETEPFAAHGTATTSALLFTDVNRDGRLDLVVGHDGSALHVYLNDPAGTAGSRFLAAVALTASAVTALAAGDFDGDGDTDLVAGGASSVVFFKNTTPAGAGTATFDAAQTVGSVSSAVTAIVVGDVDMDGDLDLVVGTASDALGLHLNRAGSPAWLGFAASTPLGSTVTTKALALGDLNRDGKLDLVAGNGTQTNTFRLGTGTGLGAARTIGAITLDIDSGPYLNVSAQGASLTILGQTIAGDFAFTQQTLADGSRIVELDVDAVLSLADGQITVPIDGTVRIANGGISAVLALGATLVVGPVSLAGTIRLLLNTSPSAVTIGSDRLPGGPYLRIEAIGLTTGTKATASFGSGANAVSIQGNFLFEQTTNSLGQRRVVVAAADVSASFGGTEVFRNGGGILVVLPGSGLAGQLSGEIVTSAFLPSNVEFVGTLAFAMNASTSAVTETVTLGGDTFVLDLPPGPFFRISALGVQLRVLGQTLSGDFTVQSATGTTTISVRNAALRLGTGTTDVVSITNANGTFTITTGLGIAGTIAGTVAVNVPGISIGGTLSLAIDTRPGTPFVRVGGTGLTLTVLGQSISGDFSFEQTTVGGARVIRLNASNVVITLGTATAGLRAAQQSGQTASLTISDAGVSGSIATRVTVLGLPTAILTIPNIDVALAFNTSATSRFVRLDVATTGTDKISIFGQQLGGAFSFEQVMNAGADTVLNTTDDVKVVRVAATNISLFLGAAPNGVSLSGGTAKFLITPAGIAGEVSATVSVTLGPVTVGPVQARVVVNTMSTGTGATERPLAVNEQFVVGGRTETLVLPAGRYIRVELTGLSLTLFGNHVSADFAFERVTGVNTGGFLDPATTVTRVSVKNFSFRLGTASRDFVVVSNGEGQLTIAATGVSGSIAATVLVDIPGVSLTGTFALAFDTATSTLKVSATNAALEVLGQRLTGNFEFEKTSTAIKLKLGKTDVPTDMVELNLGNGTTTFVSVRLRGELVLLNGGVAASFTASGLTFPGLPAATFTLSTGPITFQLNTTTAPVLVGTQTVAPGVLVRVGATGDKASVSILGQSLSGIFEFQQATSTTGTKVVRVSFSEVDFNVGTSTAGVSVTGASGSLLIVAQGIAARFQGSASVNIADFSVTADLEIEINSLSAAIDETIGGTRTKLAAGRYIRVLAEDLTVVLTAGVPAITADFVFENATSPQLGSVTKIGLANLSFTGLNDSGTSMPIVTGYGALILNSAGVAGVVYGTLAGGGSSATIGVKFNTTTAAVHAQVVVGSTTIDIDVDVLPNKYRILAELDLNFGDLVEIRGTFELDGSGEFIGTGIDLFVGRGPSLIDGADNPDAIGLLLSNATIRVKRFSPTAFGLYASGTLELLGLDGLVVEGNVELRINTSTSGAPWDPDGTGSLQSIPINSWRVTGTGIKVKVGDVLEVGGNLVVNRQPTGALDLAFSGASVKVAKIDGVWAFELGGAASFTISPTNGFRLQSFKVDGFKIFGVGLGSTGSAPTLFPTARLSLFEDALDDALQAGAQVLTTAALSRPARVRRRRHAAVPRRRLRGSRRDADGLRHRHRTQLDHRRRSRVRPPDRRRRAGRADRRGDARARRAEHVPLLPRRRDPGERRRLGAVHRQQLRDHRGGVELQPGRALRRRARPPTTVPGPLAQLSNPANGEGVTADTINAKRYIDITYSSIDGSAMQAVTGTPFTISGTGIGDLMLTATNAPVLMGSPLLVSGTAGTSKALTYRYFLKDKNTANTLEAFQAGAITVTFTPGGFSTVARRRTAASCRRSPSQRPHRAVPVRPRRSRWAPTARSSCSARASRSPTSASTRACSSSRSRSASTARS